MRAILPSLLAVACSVTIAGCSSGSGRADADDGGCSSAACERECAADGFAGGACDGGTCVCGPGPDAGDGEIPDAADDSFGDACDADVCDEVDSDADDDGTESEAEDVEEEADSGCPCNMCGPDGLPPVLDPDHREGGSPGIVCDRVPIGTNRSVRSYDAEPGIIAFIGMDDPLPGYRTTKLHVYRTATGERTVVDDLQDLIDAGVDRPAAEDPSLDGEWVAYAVMWNEPPDFDMPMHADLRLANLTTGEIRILRTYAPGRDPLRVYVTSVSLDYPWVGWKETQEWWTVHALNIETGVEHEIANSAVDLAVEGTTLTTESYMEIILFDLTTGANTHFGVGLPGGRMTPALAWPWLVWVDQRDGRWWYPEGYECDYASSCCDNDIYGFNRVTGIEVPFVVRHGMQGGVLRAEGEWAAYEDHRDGSDEFCEDHRPCRQIYALHLTTGVEVRVTNWPGEYLSPVVYSGRVLFSEMTSYGDDLYDLWDCNLVEP